MLIVSPLDQAQSSYAEHAPVRVISLLSEDEDMPQFAGLDADNHLKLYVERDMCSASISTAAKTRAAEIIQFVSKWDKSGNILIHCNYGVSRSMAAAFIVLCIMRGPGKETAIADEIRKLAPHADPCPLIVDYADELMGRDGEMIDAVENLPPPISTLAAPILTLPVAA